MSEHSPVSNLTTEQCWELLHAQEFGRLAFHLLDEVHIVPQGFLWSSHLVVDSALPGGDEGCGSGCGGCGKRL